MSIKVTEHNDVKVYNLSAGKTFPQFLKDADKEKKSLKKDDEFRRRIELLQDFEFNISCSRVRVTKDRQFVGAIGCYPPEVRIYDTNQLAMKFLRRLDHDIVDFQFLGDDWRKMVFLCSDRTLEFHAQYGKHHKIRMPIFGRTMLYDEQRCHLFLGGSSSDIHRLDLEEGIFLEPLRSNLDGVNALVKNPALPLMSAAGTDGIVEHWDLRDPRKPCSQLVAFLNGDDESNGRDATAVAYSADAMKMAVGLASGIVRVYDIRSTKPICERDHYNGLPIDNVQFHTPSTSQHNNELVVSSDKNVIKMWWYNTPDAELFTSLEGDSAITSFEMWPGSGLMFAAMEQSRVGAYFVPSLGIAPKWCSFLDSMTEELEENPSKTVFDDKHFITKEQLGQLDALHLLGTNMLQPYMHGFFMDISVYKKLKSIKNPFEYEEFRQKKIQEKIAEKRQEKWRVKPKTVTRVNAAKRAELEAKVKEGERTNASAKTKKAAALAEKAIGDDRFAKMFDNPDFEMVQLEPTAKKSRK